MHLFSSQTYKNRRARLCNRIKSGVVIFLGNNEAPMNYKDNIYRYRQDSSFLYFFGISQPGLSASIDVETQEVVIYGAELTLDDIIWVGPHPSLQSRCEQVGVPKLKSIDSLASVIKSATSLNRNVHYLPPYRHNNMIKLMALMGDTIEGVNKNFSIELIHAVIDLRSYKSPEEIVEMTEAVNITRQMHIAAMKATKPGLLESAVVGRILHEAQKHNCHLSYPAIFTINGQTLHNHFHGNIMQAGQLALNDSGAENKMAYAGDITRTFPVNGKFSQKQKDIYNIVLEMEETSISALKPGIQYKDIHISSNKIMLTRLKELGLVKGSIEDMLAQGVGGLFMPHGLGHMIGLDVHDMEDLGEDNVGYRKGINRSSQLGLKSLRLAKELETGFVLTVEPGIYFIPDLIEKWESEKIFKDWINYDNLKTYFDFGGIRIEDDVQVTESGSTILGKPIPKTVTEIEEIMG